MLLAMLMQVALFQGFVDDATVELNLGPMTVIEEAYGPNYAWVNDDTFVHAHTLLFQGRVPVAVLKFIAYHEACHVALGHISYNRGSSTREQRQIDADVCAIAGLKDQLAYSRNGENLISRFDKYMRQNPLSQKLKRAYLYPNRKR